MSKRYIVAGERPWNLQHFNEIIRNYEGDWYFASNRDELSFRFIEKVSPKYIFFLHWSHLVPDEIVKNYECVCFHMTDVPYGRGGTPLQNLIVRGHTKTKISALRMTTELDAGPVYMKRFLSLEGNAEEIYIRAGRICVEMIGIIVERQIKPFPQSGEVVTFKRRVPSESEIVKPASIDNIYDMIRMLDAASYPKAFIKKDGFRYEFDRAGFYSNYVKATVKIYPIKKE